MAHYSLAFFFYLLFQQVLSQLTFQVSATSSPQDAAKQCFCRPTQPCWPTSESFSNLSAHLSQPLLLDIRPPAYPCHDPAFSSLLCPIATNQWRDARWRVDQPGAMNAINWETATSEHGTLQGCFIGSDRKETCDQGSVPTVGVNVTRVEDIQAALRFANKHNIRVVVKTSGHDFQGRSTAPDSLLIWLHHFKNITFPESTPLSNREQAVKVTAGTQWTELYAAAAKRNRTVVGGVSIGGTVGASGGWILGGGHSAQSPTYGLGVDNVLQFTVVLANGSHITASPYYHSDLFWALRGGGGGTFGIVTSVTYRTYPSTPLLTAYFNATAATSSSYKTLLKSFFEVQSKLADQGWGGYFYPTGDSKDNPGAPPVPGEGLYSLLFIYLRPNSSDVPAANSTIYPVLQSLSALPGVSAQYATGLAPSFYDWYKMALEGPDSNTRSQVGTNSILGSRLIKRETHEERADELAKTIASVNGGLGSVEGHLIGGGAVSRVPLDAAGILPAWRTAVTQIILASGWEDNATYTQRESIKRILTDLTGRLRKLEPDSGSYLNEADAREPNWQQAFYGSHYQELRRIKDKYDPEGRFLVLNGVGWERWEESGGWCRKA